MVGILSYGVYVSRYRLPREKAFDSMGWLNLATRGYAGGKKTVVNYDEDPVTSVVEATRTCINSEREGVLPASPCPKWRGRTRPSWPKP